MCVKFVISFLALSVTAASTETICCKEIKNVLENKVLAQKTLCSTGSQLSANCCKNIASDVEKHREAYNSLCLAKTRCDNPSALGMESGEILNAAISASSTYASNYLPEFGRLRQSDGNCGWLCKRNTTSSWLQVDFGKRTVVTAVATQGSCKHNEWTKSYVIWYSDDAVNWTYYKESDSTNPKVFTGNTDRTTVVTNSFQSPIIARCMRITPKSYNSYAVIRVEYYGCR